MFFSAIHENSGIQPSKKITQKIIVTIGYLAPS